MYFDISLEDSQWGMKQLCFRPSQEIEPYEQKSFGSALYRLYAEKETHEAVHENLIAKLGSDKLSRIGAPTLQDFMRGLLEKLRAEEEIYKTFPIDPSRKESGREEAMRTQILQARETLKFCRLYQERQSRPAEYQQVPDLEEKMEKTYSFLLHHYLRERFCGIPFNPVLLNEEFKGPPLFFSKIAPYRPDGPSQPHYTLPVYVR